MRFSDTGTYSCTYQAPTPVLLVHRWLCKGPTRGGKRRAVGWSVVGGGVIASAQIEYISYVFITTAAGPLRPAISSTSSYTSCLESPLRRLATEGWRQGGVKAEERQRERERKRERERVAPWGKRREDEGWKRRKGVVEEKRQRPRHSRIPKDEEEESNRRVNERERGDERRREVGWFRRGHGKSTVRRYRLTDVRLSVVKR